VPSRKFLRRSGARADYLLQEVVRDLGLIARQTSRPHAGILTTPQRQRRQHHPSSPPLRALAQSLGRLLRQLQSSARGNLTRLLRVQGEQPGPNLDQVPAGTQTTQRHTRIPARDQHQLRTGSNPIDEKRKNRPTPLSRYHVHVIQHQDERVTHLELGGQQRKEVIDPGHRSRRRLEEFALNRADALEGLCDPREQHHRVVVALIELQPAADPSIHIAPLRDKRRLPVTRRPRHQHQPAALRDRPQRIETSSRHHPGPDRRTPKLRPPQRRPGLENQIDVRAALRLAFSALDDAVRSNRSLPHSRAGRRQSR